ncbi:MAG: alpha/beta hydrolase, partial [Phycisphaerales bacterium JB039]
VNFYNACVFAAELDHFTGRDMVAIAYAWPTHQDILPYLFGEDVDRAYESAHQFAALLRMLAERTTAERINIICWSAGGRVVSLALDELDRYERSHGFDPASLRLGAAIFAAPDVPAHRFLERLPGIHDVVERIIITASDNDVALEKAAEFMGGDMRMGLIDDSLDPDALADLDRFDHIELVDVSYDKDQRGFDIDGHRYWFRHPWVASDVVLVTRTRLPADQRGLERSHIDRVWFLPADYPDRVRTAAREALGDSWAAEGRAPRGD